MGIRNVNIERSGYIFLCSDVTENECFERKLLGGTEKYTGVEELEKGDTVYLYNFNQKRLFGPFVATTRVLKNIVPEAWKGEYPMQVRFKRPRIYLPLYRDQLIKILKFGKKGFPVEIVTPSQIVELEKLFKAKKRARNYDDSASIPTLSGLRVRSKPEMMIANWLFNHRIACAYESDIPQSTKRCDFYIPLDSKRGLYIEFWGLNDIDYLKNKESKINVYKEQNLNLIEINSSDIRNLNRLLYQALKPYFPTLEV